MRRFDTVFFDLDGTLTDPGPGITNSVRYALERFGISVGDRRELYRFIGPPLMDSFRTFYGFSHDAAAEAVRLYRVYFREAGMFENSVYPGISALLDAMRADGRRLVVATSKPEEFAVTIMDHFGLSQYFDCIAGAAMDETRTQKWEVIDYAVDRCGLADRGGILMVGDREHDILGARRCALGGAVGVLYGYGDRAELTAAGADAVAETVAELGALILNRNYFFEQEL